MIHNSFSSSPEFSFVSYSINGGEHIRDFDHGFLTSVLRSLRVAMDLEQSKEECVMRAFSLCVDNVNSSLVRETVFDWDLGLTVGEFRVIEDFTFFVRTLCDYRLGALQASSTRSSRVLRGGIERVPTLSFSYQNNNTGKVLVWMHINDCSDG